MVTLVLFLCSAYIFPTAFLKISLIDCWIPCTRFPYALCARQVGNLALLTDFVYVSAVPLLGTVPDTYKLKEERFNFRDPVYGLLAPRQKHGGRVWWVKAAEFLAAEKQRRGALPERRGKGPDPCGIQGPPP